MFTFAYGLTAYFIIIGMLPLWSLSTFLSSKKALGVILKFRGKTKPIDMLPAMIDTAKTNTLYGVLLTLSSLLSVLFSLIAGGVRARYSNRSLRISRHDTYV